MPIKIEHKYVLIYNLLVQLSFCQEFYFANIVE